jgi:hypothetical protein
MLSWGTILYGAALSAVAGIVLVAVALRERRAPVLVVAGGSAALGAFLWNAILHRLGAREFFVDAPVAVMPASWQDTGSGVFAVAVTYVMLGFGPLRRALAQAVALAALVCGLAAFLVDVYLY